MKILLVFLFIVGAPVMGFGEIYRCEFTRSHKGDWLPTRLLVEHVAGQETADVWDPFIKYYVGKPQQAKVIVENDKRVSYKWSIERLTNTQGRGRQFTPELVFRVTVLKPSLRAMIHSMARGYPNSFRGSGQCRPLPAKHK